MFSARHDFDPAQMVLAQCNDLIHALARGSCRASGVLSYSPTVRQDLSLLQYRLRRPLLLVRRVAVLAQVLKGTKPADLPVELPTKVELLVNLNTAKTLGREMPLSLLIRADELIE